jgi:hypothetical protein
MDANLQDQIDAYKKRLAWQERLDRTATEEHLFYPGSVALMVVEVPAKT